MTTPKTFQSVLLSKRIIFCCFSTDSLLAVYSEFINLICDPDASIRQNAINCIVEGAKLHPRFFIEMMTERLSPVTQNLTIEYFGYHIELLKEFIKDVKKEKIQGEMSQIYNILKEVVQVIKIFVLSINCIDNF